MGHPPFPIIYPFLCDDCRRKIWENAGPSSRGNFEDLLPILCRQECHSLFDCAVDALQLHGRRISVPNRTRIRALEMIREGYISVIRIKSKRSTRQIELNRLAIQFGTENIFLDEEKSRHWVLPPDESELIKVPKVYLPMASAVFPSGVNFEYKKLRTSQIGDYRNWFRLHGKYTWKFLKTRGKER